MELVAKSKKARRTGSTDCNPNSSRSHAVMIIHVERRDVNNPGAPACVGKLNLVDLAGSERINKVFFSSLLFLLYSPHHSPL